MDAIFVVLRTGCQWQALNETKLCARSAAQRRVPAWVEADVFVALWEQGLVDYDAFIGKYLSSLGKLDDIVAPKEGFEAQL